MLELLKKKYAVYLLFALIWVYIIIRAFTVFYLHDELVSKWAYMIDWNAFPYQGYIDANNQFLNSLLGGFFIRLFDSDAMWIVRLPNLLAFPLFFFSAAAFKRYFKHSHAFYFFLISITCAPFILDFFSLARGYGLAWAFFMWSIFQLLRYLEERKLKALILFVVASIFTLYANLSLLPVVFIMCAYLIVFQFTFKLNWRERFINVLAFLALFVVFGFAIEYALNLQSIGKLYLGSPDNFFRTTVEPLGQFLWSLEGAIAFILIAILSLFVVANLGFRFIKLPNLFSVSTFFPILLIAALLAIFLQNIILEVNYPTDRSAAQLVFLFYGSLAFAFDSFNRKYISVVASGALLFLFVFKANFTHTLNYVYEHYDLELLTKIPREVKGIPPSTAGKFYAQDNELNRVHGLPMLAVQAVIPEPIVYQDYIIDFKEGDTLYKEYEIIHYDPISELCLFERKKFLDRKLLFTESNSFDGSSMFVNLIEKQSSRAGFVRCSGYFENMVLNNQSTIVFAQENTGEGEKLAYGGISPVTSAPIDAEGRVSFDFTYTMMDFKEADEMAIYIFNKHEVPLKGEITIEFYEIEF